MLSFASAEFHAVLAAPFGCSFIGIVVKKGYSVVCGPWCLKQMEQGLIHRKSVYYDGQVLQTQGKNSVRNGGQQY